MARITYDDETAAAFKAVREIPRDGLGHWRDAIRRHLNPMPAMTVTDIGAGTGTFAAAFSDWFAQADTFRRADSTMRTLTEEEFLRGKERLRRAAQDAEQTRRPEPRTSWLDLLVLR